MATHIEEEEPARLGRRLQAVMKFRGLGFDALAAATGIPVRTLYRYAADETDPPRPKLERIADALKVRPSQLVGWDPLTLELLGLNLAVPVAHKPVKKNSSESLSRRSTSRSRAA